MSEPQPTPATPATPAAEALAGGARLKAMARPVLASLALVFVGLAAWDLKRRWRSGEVEIDYVWVGLSLLPLVVGVLVLALGWTWLLSQMSGSKVPKLRGIALHVESQAARYTPGKVGVPLVRMLGAEQLGTTARIVVSSVFVELLCWVAVGGTMAFALLFVSGDLARSASDSLGAFSLAILVGFALALLCLLVVDRRRLPAKLRSLLTLEGTGPLVPAKLPLIHAAYWLTWAAHGYLIGRAIQLPPGLALAGSGLYVLAPVMGFLALVAPGGLGVREAVLSVALAPSIGPAAALYAALLSRATSVAVDLGTWLALRPFRAKPIRKSS